MPIFDLENVIRHLEKEWGTYVVRFQKLTQKEQQEFLEKQGYETLKDLVAHFTAWWEQGMDIIEIKKGDPNYFYPDIDVDEFNARAVAAAQGLSESEVLQRFESTRQQFIDCVNGLSNEDWRQPNILKQLDIEIFGHLQEHALPLNLE